MIEMAGTDGQKSGELLTFMAHYGNKLANWNFSSKVYWNMSGRLAIQIIFRTLSHESVAEWTSIRNFGVYNWKLVKRELKAGGRMSSGNQLGFLDFEYKLAEVIMISAAYAQNRACGSLKHRSALFTSTPTRRNPVCGRNPISIRNESQSWWKADLELNKLRKMPWTTAAHSLLEFVIDVAFLSAEICW